MFANCADEKSIQEKLSKIKELESNVHQRELQAEQLATEKGKYFPNFHLI